MARMARAKVMFNDENVQTALLFHELRGRFKEVTAFEYLRVLSRKDAILIIRK